MQIDEQTKILIDLSTKFGELTGIVKSMKEVHDTNAITIKEIDKKIYGLDSWKNRLEQHITDEKEMAIMEVNKRLKPLEEHVEKVKNINFDKDKMILESRLSLREKIVLTVLAWFPTVVSAYLAIKYGISKLD
jgi:ABC-type proline/glycine betaine transport system substrate-binding protein